MSNLARPNPSARIVTSTYGCHMTYYNWFIALNVIHIKVEPCVVEDQVSRIYDHSRSCLTDFATSVVTQSIRLEWARSVPNVLDVRDGVT